MKPLNPIELLQAINDAQSLFIANNDVQVVFDGLLAGILGLTESEYGFIGEVLFDEHDLPYLKTYAVTNIAWDEPTRSMFEQQAALGIEFRNLNTLFGAALTSREPVISDEPLHDPRSGGLPEGHPAMHTFMGIPVSVAGKLVAMIGMANRPGGYDKAMIEFLQPLLNTIAQLIEARRIEFKQRETEQSYRELFANISDSIFMLSEQGVILEVNRGTAEMYACSREQLIGMSAEQVLAPNRNNLEEVLAAMHKAFAGQSQRLELWGQRTSGEIFLKESNFYPADLMGNKVIMVVARDITEQREVEDELRQHREELQYLVDARTAQLRAQADIIDQIHDSVVSTDLQGVVTSWNQGAQRLFGYSMEEAVGQNIAFVYPEDQQPVLLNEVIAPLLEKGLHDTEVIMQRKTGEHFYAHLSLSVLHDAGGEVIGMIGYAIDITEQKQVEQRLQESEAYMTQLLTRGPAIIYSCIPEGDFPATFISDNVRDIMGFEPEQFLHDSGFWANNVHPDDAARVFGDLGQLFEHDSHTHEYRFRRNDGSYMWVHDELRLQRNKDGVPYSIIGYWADISAMKETEIALQQTKEEAERANRAKSEFLANMSHELRTPMHSVLSFSKLGMKRYMSLEQDKIGEFFNRIHDSGERLMGLLNDLLDLSKLEAGKMMLNYEQANLRDITQSCIHDLGPDLAGKGVACELQDNVSETQVACDKQRIYQVIMNILSNAIRFSPEKGRLTVLLEAVSRANVPAVCVRVFDDGIGLPEDELDDIFDKFIQSSTTKTGAGGTGLGLAICREIIALHQGRIYAANRPEGGAVFSFELPLKPASLISNE